MEYSGARYSFHVRGRLKFCVYEHWRPDKNVCFYVGKGTRKRALLISRKENQRHLRIVAKLQRMGLSVEVRIFADDLSDTEAFRLEIARIAELRAAGADLANVTNGGEGAAGAVRSEKFKAHLSRVLKGRRKARVGPLSDGHKRAISEGLKGRAVSEETRAKLSAAQKGKPRPELIGRRHSPEAIERMRNRVFTEEHRSKISAAKRGVPKSPEHREKLSDALRGRTLTPEHIEKSVAPRRGVPRSAETKAAISAAKKGRPSPLRGRTRSPEIRARLVAAWKQRKARAAD